MGKKFIRPPQGLNLLKFPNIFTEQVYSSPAGAKLFSIYVVSDLSSLFVPRRG